MQKWYIHQDETGEYGYELRDGKLYYIERDKASGSASEEEIPPQDFLKHYAGETKDPYPEILGVVKTLA